MSNPSGPRRTCNGSSDYRTDSDSPTMIPATNRQESQIAEPIRACAAAVAMPEDAGLDRPSLDVMIHLALDQIKLLLRMRK
jgi:hypothetical protein